MLVVQIQDFVELGLEETKDSCKEGRRSKESNKEKKEKKKDGQAYRCPW